jgi:hypothetical protein
MNHRDDDRSAQAGPGPSVSLAPALMAMGHLAAFLPDLGAIRGLANVVDWQGGPMEKITDAPNGRRLEGAPALRGVGAGPVGAGVTVGQSPSYERRTTMIKEREPRDDSVVSARKCASLGRG